MPDCPFNAGALNRSHSARQMIRSSLDLPQVRPRRPGTPGLQKGGGNHSATSSFSLMMSFHFASLSGS